MSGLPPVRTLLVGVFACLAIVLLARPEPDPDLWGHLLYGRASLLAGAPERVDRYSYTCAGAPWVNHEWYAEVIYAALWDGLGAPGLFTLKALIAALMVLVVVVRSRGVGFGPRLALLAATTAMLAPGTSYRPQLFSYLLFFVLLLAIDAARRRRLAWWAAVPPLFALWPNLHGGFLAGLGVLGLAAAAAIVEAIRDEDAGWRPAWVAAAALALAIPATLLTPYGVELWRFLRSTLGTARPQISEWASVPLLSLEQWWVKLTVLAAAVVVVRTRARRDLAELAILGATAVLWLRHERHLTFLALALAVHLPRHLAARWPADDEDDAHPWPVRLAVAGLLALSAGLPVVWAARGIGVPTATHPVGALRHIDRHALRGRLLVHFDWAQYAIYRLFPACQVAYDGRFRTVYPRDLEAAFFAWNLAQPGGEAILTRPGADLVLVPADERVRGYCHTNPTDWRLLYLDDTAALYGRRGSAAERRAPPRRPPPELPREVPFPGD